MSLLLLLEDGVADLGNGEGVHWIVLRRWMRRGRSFVELDCIRGMDIEKKTGQLLERVVSKENQEMYCILVCNHAIILIWRDYSSLHLT
jgi:hypothetical protein